MNKEKEFCKYCGVPISLALARQTNGYCTAHASLGLDFRGKIPGVVESVERVDPATVRLPNVTGIYRLEIRIQFDKLLRKIIAGDHLVFFRTRPSSPDQRRYANAGYAVVRNGEWIDGIVTEWLAGSDYWRDAEYPSTREELVRSHPEVWEELRKQLKENLGGSDVVVHFRSSPASWAALCGREGYAVKRDGKYLASVERVLK